MRSALSLHVDDMVELLLSAGQEWRGLIHVWLVFRTGGKLVMKDMESESDRHAKRLASMLSALFERYGMVYISLL